MKKRQKTKLAKRRQCRVFIFGAGASASCGIAVAKDILRESMAKLVARDAEKANRVHKLLKYLYPSFDQRLRNYPNIEDFLNLLEMAKMFNTEEFIESKLWSDKKLDEVKRITLKAVTEYIWEFMQDREKLRPIRDFVTNYLRVEDIVITFNWDLTVERALHDHPEEFHITYSYSRDSQEKRVVLLKPHGSIDWFTKNDLPAGKLRQNVMTLDQSVCVYPYFDFAKNPELLKYEPRIVPPVSTKEFQGEFFKRTWRSVYRALSDATALHILGYSLPKEDQFARLVLRRAIRNNILKAEKHNKRPLKVVVVNPDENTEGTFSRLVGAGVAEFHFEQAYFQDYVAGLQEETEE